MLARRTPERAKGTRNTFVGLVACACLWSPAAAASDDYVGVLVGYGYPSACTFCHRDPQGGEGTVDKLFAKGLQKDYGLVGNKNGSDTSSLVAALAAAEADEYDADEDGVPDVEELRGAGNPNDPNVVLGGEAPTVLP